MSPRPPARLTAVASWAVEATSIGAHTIGWSIPKRSVERVCRVMADHGREPAAPIEEPPRARPRDPVGPARLPDHRHLRPGRPGTWARGDPGDGRARRAAR